MERLDKFLCDSGAGTRSQVKVMLKAGRVTVDGRVEKDNSRKIDPAKLRPITFDAANRKYIVLGEAVGNAFSDGNALK